MTQYQCSRCKRATENSIKGCDKCLDTYTKSGTNLVDKSFHTWVCETGEGKHEKCYRCDHHVAGYFTGPHFPVTWGCFKCYVKFCNEKKYEQSFGVNSGTKFRAWAKNKDGFVRFF